MLRQTDHRVMTMLASRLKEPPCLIAENLRVEWDECHLSARARVLEQLEGMGVSPATLDYAGKLRLYFRAAFLLSDWAPDAEHRRRLTCSLASHIVAMKFLDDLVDRDSSLDDFELGGGSLLLLLNANHELMSSGPSGAVARVLADDFTQICRTQLACKKVPAGSLDAWLGYARDYGARFLGTYGKLGGLDAGLGEAASEVPRRFAEAFGMIITIADDLTDYTRHGERIGNIGALLMDDVVSAEQIAELLEQQVKLAEQAWETLPSSHDLRPVARMHGYDVIDRILPEFARAKLESGAAVQHGA
jgi:hypothetical protein